MANLAPVFKQRFFDANGDPLVGGKLFSCAAGTNTPKGTFKNRDADQSNTNPIILDANGECDVWIYGTYKFVLKDANDVTQWTVDKVSGEAQVIMSVADLTARDAIPAALRYEGMLVYVVSENRTYQLQGGITNANWAVFYGSTPVIDTFAGNGVLTTFNLTTNPGFKENVLVFIDGVRQEISQYSTVDSALTFGFAPYDGASIQTIVQTVNIVNVPANASVTTLKIADLNVTTEKLDNESVTREKLSPLNENLSSSSGSFTTSTSGSVPIANLTNPINYTSGRPVKIALQPDGGATGGGIACSSDTSFELFRGITRIAVFRCPGSGSVQPTYFSFVDLTPTAGAETYSWNTIGSASRTVLYLKSLVYEL